MKNSPGSMIGGIGFTTCVREVQVSRTTARTSSTSSSSTPRKIVAFERLRKPPNSTRAWHGIPCRAARRRGPRRPRCARWPRRASSRGVSVPHRRGSTRQRPSSGVRCGPRRHACRSRSVSTDGQSRDPRSHLSAAIRAATSDDLDLALAGILDAALAGSGAAADDPVRRPRPGRAAARGVGRHGRGRGAGADRDTRRRGSARPLW